MEFNPQTRLAVKKSQTPVVTAASVVATTGADTLGFEEVLCLVDIGAATGSGSFAVTVLESSDNSTWTAVPGAAFTVIDATHDDNTDPRLGRIKLQKRKRYLAYAITLTGTLSAVVGAYFILGATRDTALTADTYDFNVLGWS